jgi:hypothetical protein
MDMTTLIIIFAIIALVMFFLNRNRMISRGWPTTYGDPYTRGNERPTYDDPGYSSSGSIGGTRQPDMPQERSVGRINEPHHDDPKYRSGGSIGGSS